MKKRRRARELVLQALYAVEISKNPMRVVLESISENGGNDPDVVLFASTLFKRTWSNIAEIDREIATAAENWKLERIALIDKLILRLALSELLYFDDIPPKVTINEAIDLAKMYSTSESGRFVNGVLDSIYNKFKTENRIVKRGRGLIG